VSGYEVCFLCRVGLRERGSECMSLGF
jgi:hypothetical protein